MCEPTLIITSIAAVSGVMQQQAAADSQSASNQRQAQNVRTAQVQNFNQINLERSQASDSAGQKINANNVAQREAQSTVVAQAGPSGLSVDNLLANLGTRGASYNQSVNENLDRTNLSLDNQLENVNNSAASSINSLKTPAPVDYLGGALKIGGAGYDYYTKTQALKTGT